MRPLAVALGTLLQARGRAAQQQAEHAPGIRVQRVGRARAPSAQVLEGPRADERLGVALLLHPADRGGLLVAEAKQRLDGLDLSVRLRLDQRGALVRMALEHLDVLQRALPFRRL